MIPQTTFVLTFRPHIISELGGVYGFVIRESKIGPDGLNLGYDFSWIYGNLKF